MGIDAQMLIKIKEKEHSLSEKRVKKLSWEVCEAFGRGQFYIEKGDNKYLRPHGALEIVQEYEQDGPSILPEGDMQLIEVHLWTRYYGEGYERGDLPFIVCLASWLEGKIPHSEIYYGGDSSGVLAEKFDKARRKELFDYFIENGHFPYNGDKGFGNKNITRYCDFCDHEMTQKGYGPTYASFICFGCGRVDTTNDNGETWEIATD